MGIYKVKNGRFFGGKILNHSPAASGPGSWDGDWFRTKSEAFEYCERYLEDQKDWENSFYA